MSSLMNSIKHKNKRNNINSSQTLLENRIGGNTSQLILCGHHHPSTKTRQRYYKKKKLQTNNTDEYRCKNPQQNTSKQNPTTH